MREGRVSPPDKTNNSVRVWAEPYIIRRQSLGDKHVDDFTAHARRRIDTIRPQFDIHTTGVDRMVQRHNSRKTVSVSERKERYVSPCVHH